MISNVLSRLWLCIFFRILNFLVALELGQGHGSLCQRVQAPPPSYQASDKQDIIHSGPDLPWQDSSRVPVGEPVWIK